MIILRCLFVVLLCGLSVNSVARDHIDQHIEKHTGNHSQPHSQPHANYHPKGKHGGAQALALPQELNNVLRKEMNALKLGLSSLMPEVIAGNWQQIQSIGQKMHDSYILKQSLSKEQVSHLHHSLPKHFLTLDHQLHHSAGMMAHAAEKKNMELVNFYLYKITETCVSCHSQYATHRFPQLVVKQQH